MNYADSYAGCHNPREDRWAAADREAGKRVDEANEAIDAAAVSLANELGLKDVIALARKLRVACTEATEQELMS